MLMRTMVNKKYKNPNGFLSRRSVWFLSIALCGVVNGASAFEVDTGNPEVKVFWDNTLRYNLGMRAENAGNAANSPNFDEGESKFDKGDVVTNRTDLISELDIIYQEDFGARVSGTAWYDDAYRNGKAKRNPDLQNFNGSYSNDNYSGLTKRYYRGPSGEILDAFVFGRFHLGEMPLTVKAGQHTVFWGESLALSGAINGISYSQMPLDLRKAFATPAIGAKELFLPLTNISSQLTITDELDIAAQYFLDWKPTRIPEGGTYLGPADFLAFGPDIQGAAPFVNEGIHKPDQRGDWGVNMNWRPMWLDGTVGFYYRNFTDKILSIFRTGSTYGSYFAEDIDLYGISLSKQYAGISFGGEISYRRNMALAAQTLGTATYNPVLHPNGPPQLIGNSYQARGNTWHGVFNAVGILPTTSVYDSGVWQAELTYARLDKVTKNKDMYFGEGYGVCDKSRKQELGAAFKDKWDQCSTKDMVALSFGVTPTWLQVFPGVDFSMPLSYSRTLKGNAPVQLGGNEKNGNYSVGISAEIYAKYLIDLKYVDYFGAVKESPSSIPGKDMVTSANGLSTALKDRGWVSLTLQTSF
jgi:hypothetical protein